MSPFFSKIFKPVISLASIIGIPITPKKNTVDMSKFELTFCDDFDGNELNKNVWTAHLGCDEKNTLVRHGGYWNSSLAEVSDGCLKIKTKYLENGVNEGDAPGWYTAALDTSDSFRQKFGYFEVRAKCPKHSGQWAAFWLFDWAMTEVTGNGENGAEIDIMESAFFGKKIIKDRASHCVHYDGYDFPAHKSTVARQYKVLGNAYDEFNTYALEWNEDEYIFYINGRETYRTKFGKTSKIPEFIILSCEVGGKSGTPGMNWAGKSFKNTDKNVETEFVVDYVKAYQYKNLIEK